MAETTKIRKLTRKQNIFCYNVARDKTVEEASKEARISYQHGRELATKPVIIAEIQRQKADIQAASGVTLESIVQELQKLALCDIKEAFDADGNLRPIADIPLIVRKAIASIEIFGEFQGQGAKRKYIGNTAKVKFWPKTDALGQLMKHLGGFEKDNKQKNEPLSALMGLLAEARGVKEGAVNG